MKSLTKTVFFVSLILFLKSGSLSAQTNKDLLINKWKFLGEETFAVVTPPDSVHKNDILEFKSDGTYEMVSAGVKSTGTYNFNESVKTIAFTDAESKKTATWFFKKVTADNLVIEYQTPDLIRTRYQYAVMK